jgi:3-isopropylmalate/(R)-2-methylmalate dehydratase small subunit
MNEIRGRAWRFGDHVDTDQIIPAERLISQNNNCLGDFLFERVRPEMTKSVQMGDIIVAGKNFGCGSSREHAPRAIKQAGITCVVAESYARIFYRNSINVGMLPIECKIEAEEGDILAVDLQNGKIVNETNGMEWQFAPFPPFIKDLMERGGLMAKIREEKRCIK